MAYKSTVCFFQREEREAPEQFSLLIQFLFMGHRDRVLGFLQERESARVWIMLKMMT